MDKSTWHMCQCHHRVPPHVSSSKCWYCHPRKPILHICSGPCGKPVPAFVIKDPSKCTRCRDLEYPWRGCDTCKEAFTEHKSRTTCAKCIRKKNFLNYLGPMDAGHVIKINFKLDCNPEIKHSIFLPAPQKIVNLEIDLYGDILDYWEGLVPKYFTRGLECLCSEGVHSTYLSSVVSTKLRKKKRSDLYLNENDWKYFVE